MNSISVKYKYAMYNNMLLVFMTDKAYYSANIVGDFIENGLKNPKKIPNTEEVTEEEREIIISALKNKSIVFFIEDFENNDVIVELYNKNRNENLDIRIYKDMGLNYWKNQYRWTYEFEFSAILC